MDLGCMDLGCIEKRSNELFLDSGINLNDPVMATSKLHELRRLEVKVPVIVVGCKLDLQNENRIAVPKSLGSSLFPNSSTACRLSSTEERDPHVSLSDFLNRKLHRSSILPSSAQVCCIPLLFGCLENGGKGRKFELRISCFVGFR
ncbi:hypothetical protein LOK49_LG11G02904 [Camellia lanceoleosa]|uniref:Uncharacterized protein n=1 Tax=Camellia lanceoleosa TaxID=1840588 RepID=A0ACC0G2R9_9ERIC|nr:hypothetical protein LOK49_LG11G02904 [Camellia lanceoleosa]